MIHATCDGLVERLRPEPFGVIEVLRAPGVETSCAIAATRDGSLVLRGTDDGLDVFDVVKRTVRVLGLPAPRWGRSSSLRTRSGPRSSASRTLCHGAICL